MKVLVDGQSCGTVNDGKPTVLGKKYTVTCSDGGVFGSQVKLVTTMNSYLHFEGITVMTKPTGYLNVLNDLDLKLTGAEFADHP